MESPCGETDSRPGDHQPILCPRLDIAENCSGTKPHQSYGGRNFAAPRRQPPITTWLYFQPAHYSRPASAPCPLFSGGKWSSAGSPLSISRLPVPPAADPPRRLTERRAPRRPVRSGLSCRAGRLSRAMIAESAHHSSYAAWQRDHVETMAVGTLRPAVCQRSSGSQLTSTWSGHCRETQTADTAA